MTDNEGYPEVREFPKGYPEWAKLHRIANDPAWQQPMGRYFGRAAWAIHCILVHGLRKDITYWPLLGTSRCEHGWHQR